MGIQYEENEFFSENFVRLTALCDDCSRPLNRAVNHVLKIRTSKTQQEASLPYKD